MKQRTNTYRNLFSRSYENRSNKRSHICLMLMCKADSDGGHLYRGPNEILFIVLITIKRSLCRNLSTSATIRVCNSLPSSCHKRDLKVILSFRSFTVIIFFVNNSYNRYVNLYQALVCNSDSPWVTDRPLNTRLTVVCELSND